MSEHEKLYFRNLPGVDFDLAEPTDPDFIKYKLFTKDSPDNHVELTEDNVEEAIIDKNVKTVVTIHGWTSSDSSPWYGPLKEAYLRQGHHNIIYVDWSKYAKMAYKVSCATVKPIGEHIAQLLKKSGIPAKNIHLIGHSLGAQLSSFIGKAYQKMNGEKLGRITALDPAGPHWSNPSMSEKERLNKSDADFVDVIHTDIQLYGYTNPCGHVDFYPNGGKDQPACPEKEERENFSHHRAPRFFIESIKTKIKALEIDFHEDEGFNIAITCKNVRKEVVFGEHTDRTVRGVFYLETNPEEPYLIVPKSLI